MLNYIGSKHSLLPFIEEVFQQVSEGDEAVLCDIFAGTGSVSRHFKKSGFKVISNDIQYYSYVINRAYVGISEIPKFDNLLEKYSDDVSASDNLFPEPVERALSLLNGLQGVKGFISKHYSPFGNRMYFTTDNAVKGDAIRQAIERWRDTSILSDDEYYYLLCSLIEALDKVANTASVYGAYLKKFKGTALKPLKLKPLEVVPTDAKCEVYNLNGNDLIGKIECDVLYIDPPYNHRQYGANYHVLETIAQYDEPELSGVSGMREYYKSEYCMKNMAVEAFQELIENARARHILVSYNDEGLISVKDILRALGLRGNPTSYSTSYNRYKADNNRQYKRNETVEYIHYVRTAKT